MATATKTKPKSKKVTIDLTTGIGTLSFPKVFPDTHGKKDDGSPDYNIQIIIPKSQKKDIRDLLVAIKTVGEGEWGDRWKSVRNPLRDGDKEKGKFAEDGSTYEEKYPERLGCFFINARSTRPVPVVGRDRSIITDSADLYGGCKGKISITLYPYASNGNTGIAAGLNGVQKISDGEPFGGGAPAVDSMFDILDDEDDEDLGLEDIDLDDDEDEEEVEEVKPKAKAKKSTAAPAKKKAAKKAPEPEPDEDDDDEDEDDDMFDDLDD